jgi:thiol:disulfide interchange protein DsbD
MGFPMLGTAIWLCSVAQAHYGKRVLWLGLFLVVLACCAWIYGAFIQRGGGRRSVAWLCLWVLLAAGYGYGLEARLRWRTPLPAESSEHGSLAEGPDGIPWQPWSRTAVDEARAVGRPVFVDFTADWCLTCQANKKTSIEIPAVRERLKAINAATFLGDYTRTPPAITEELRRFGRAGVPLVVVYPRDSNAPPLVLPELLKPSLVLDALDKAAK